MSPPPGNPPKEVFGPVSYRAFSFFQRAHVKVWTVLYGLMGYASHLAVRAFDSAVTPQGT